MWIDWSEAVQMGATWGRHNWHHNILHIYTIYTIIFSVTAHLFLVCSIFWDSSCPILIVSSCPYTVLSCPQGRRDRWPQPRSLSRENIIRYMTPNQTHRHQLHLSLTENTSTSTPKRAVSHWSCLLHEAICWTRTVYMFDTVHMFLPQCDVTWHGAMVDKAWCPETREDQTHRHQLHLSLTENTSTSALLGAVSHWSCLLHEAVRWTWTVYMFDTVYTVCFYHNVT